ncbi:hypothetical protein A2U01_0056215 [Trifolium medium]|uniref:Uncharacterized protein n=1 Tax=Trifolium medium TaxID=97028 RepID=A0A392RG33_9FABA|nr:hypothetical protein [Trifolium medium]
MTQLTIDLSKEGLPPKLSNILSLGYALQDGNKIKVWGNNPPQQYLQQYPHMVNLEADFQIQHERVAAHQTHVRTAWEQQQVAYQTHSRHKQVNTQITSWTC